MAASEGAAHSNQHDPDQVLSSNNRFVEAGISEMDTARTGYKHLLSPMRESGMSVPLLVPDPACLRLLIYQILVADLCRLLYVA